MSGFEVVGLGLGILPLLISTVEHYDDIIRPFRQYKHFHSEVKRFRDEISSEQVIFRAESLLLLASVTSYDVAEKMVEVHDHPSWKDPDLEKRLSERLGGSCEACKNIISLIDDDLDRIRRKSQFFDKLNDGYSLPVNYPRLSMSVFTAADSHFTIRKIKQKKLRGGSTWA